MKEGLSLRDRALLMILGIVVLYVAAGLAWIMSVQHKWTVSLKKYERENDLIAETDRWNMEYLSEKEKMPMFPEGEDVDTHWLNMMDNLATTNYIAISRRQYGKEVAKGDVFELPVEVSGWEGSLEGLVKFLWDVQSNGQSMMDVSAITMRPSQKKGFLKGTFTLTCAYMRGEVQQGDDEGEPAAAQPQSGDSAEGGAEGAAAEGAAAPDGAGAPEEPAGKDSNTVEKAVGKAAEE